MDRRRLNVLIALFAFFVVVAALTYFDVYATRQATETVAFAPAESADESVAPSEAVVEPTAPAVATEEPLAAEPSPPAAVAEGAPAAEPPATAPAVAESGPAATPSTDAGSGSGADTQVAMANPKASESSPALPVMPGTPVVPTFDVVRVEPTGEAVVAGQAEPEAKVEVLDGPAAIGTAEANVNGEWAISLDKPLVPGSHDLSVRTTSKDKTTSTLSDQRVTVSVPEKGSNDVLVVLNSPDAASKILAVPDGTQPEDKATGGKVASAQPLPAEEAPAAEPSVAEAEPPIAAEPTIASEPKVALEPPVAGEAPVKAEPPIAAEPQVVAKAEPAPQPAPPPLPTPEVAVAAVEADTSGSLYVAGTAATGETVRIYIDGKAIGDAQPSPSGTWLVQTSRDMPAGHYTVRADQLDSAGNVIARSEVPFEREVDVAVLKPSGVAGDGAESGATLTSTMPMETVIIKKGDNLWRIARGAWGKGVRWSTIYQANTEQIRDPHWIYPGQVFVMPKGNATWTD